MVRSTWILAVLCLTCSEAVRAGPAASRGFAEKTLERAFEMGCSLAIAEVLSVRQEGGMSYYRSRIVRVIVAGDLEKDDIQAPVELFAGAAFGEALRPGRSYALFLMKDAPYSFSWCFRNDAVEVDPLCGQSLRPLIVQADRIYQGSPIRRFRKDLSWFDTERAELPDELASLCKEFRRGSRWRADAAKAIYESDLGSRPDNSRPESSVREYLPPKISLSRREVLSLFGHPTCKKGWTYAWCCADVHTTDAQVGVLSITFDESERVKQLLYHMNERSDWLRRRTIAQRLAAMEGDPAGVARQFQEALKASQWDRALALCSANLQAEAQKCDSAEGFFARFVPIEAVVARRFNPHMFSSREGSVTRVSDEVDLDAGDHERPYRWFWTLERSGDTWRVDFAPIPLEAVVAKERAKRAFAEPGSITDREEFNKAIRYALRPKGGPFTIGQSMRFSLEMKNVGDEPMVFHRMDVMAQDPMIVIDPGGRVLPCADTDVQLGVAPDAILPGETIVLADAYDVTSQYRILNPGRYTFQFKTHTAKSNICTLEVGPGPLPAVEQIVEKFLPILPVGWRLQRSTRVLPGGRPGGSDFTSLFITLTGKPGGKGNRYGMTILVLVDADPFETDPWLKERYDLWGLSPWGPVYARVNEVEPLWPDYRKAIIEALHVQTRVK